MTRAFDRNPPLVGHCRKAPRRLVAGDRSRWRRHAISASIAGRQDARRFDLTRDDRFLYGCFIREWYIAYRQTGCVWARLQHAGNRKQRDEAGADSAGPRQFSGRQASHRKFDYQSSSGAATELGRLFHDTACDISSPRNQMDRLVGPLQFPRSGVRRFFLQYRVRMGRAHRSNLREVTSKCRCPVHHPKFTHE